MLDIGLSQATQRFVTRALAVGNRDDTNIAVSTSFFLFLAIGSFSVLLTLFVIVFGPHFIESKGEIDVFRKVVLSLGLSSSISFLFFAFKGILIARMRYDITSYIEILALFLRTALIVAFVKAGYSIVALAVITAVVEIFANLTIFYYVKSILPYISIKFSHCKFDELTKYFHYGIYIFITVIADKIRFSVDSLVIAKFIGLELVTHYAVATRLIEYFSLLMQRIFSVIMPALTEDHAKGDWHALREKFIVVSEISGFVSVFIGGVILIDGKVFITWWMGEKYLDALPSLIILCISITIAVSQSPSVATLNAIAKHKYYSIITSLEAVANLVLSLILVKSYGITGVAVGTAIPLMFNKLIFQPIYTCRQIDFVLSKYALVYGKNLAFGVIMHAMFYTVAKIYAIEGNIIYMAVATTVYSVAYFIIGLNFIFSEAVVFRIASAIPARLSKIIFLKHKSSSTS
jgi:O-antigen/teichoic acid export membrane protein